MTIRTATKTLLSNTTTLLSLAFLGGLSVGPVKALLSDVSPSGGQSKTEQNRFYYSTEHCPTCLKIRDSVDIAIAWLSITNRTAIYTVARSTDTAALHYWKMPRKIEQIPASQFDSIVGIAAPLFVRTDSAGVVTRTAGTSAWLTIRKMVESIVVDTVALRRLALASIKDNEDYFQANGSYAERVELLRREAVVRWMTPISAYRVAPDRKAWWTAEIVQGRFRCTLAVGVLPQELRKSRPEGVSCS